MSLRKIDWKDPLLLVSMLLAVVGGVQASTGWLSQLAEQYPMAFGLSMMGISIVTGVLTTIKSFIMSGGPES